MVTGEELCAVALHLRPGIIIIINDFLFITLTRIVKPGMVS